jgi:hypothetical protein
MGESALLPGGSAEVDAANDARATTPNVVLGLPPKDPGSVTLASKARRDKSAGADTYSNLSNDLVPLHGRHRQTSRPHAQLLQGEALIRPRFDTSQWTVLMNASTSI